MATILPATALQKINLMVEEAWSPNQNSIETQSVKADSLKAQLSRQNQLGGNLINVSTDPKKDYDAEIFWIDFCNQSASDGNDADTYCGDLTAATAGVNSKQYKIQQSIVDSFSVSESTFAGSFMDINGFIAQSHNNKIKNLLELLNKKYLLALHANAGFNRGGYYTPNATTGVTEIPAADYANTNLVAQLIIDAELSQIMNPFYVSGTAALYKTWLQAKFNAGNDTGKGDAARSAYPDLTFDLFGFNRAGATVANSTFAVTPYAMAFVNKSYYGNSFPEYDETSKKWKYTINIPSYGIAVDVLHQRVCENAKKDRYSHVFNYVVHYDFFTNPNGCADVNGKKVSGIVEYVKV